MKSESTSAPAPVAVTTPIVEGPWWRQLNRYHWFVFAMASLAWLFDCLDQQLFIIARTPAIATSYTADVSPDTISAFCAGLMLRHPVI